jgi:hypothetical protein
MTDALERLKNRARPTVRSRDASLTPTTPDISASRFQESEKPGNYGNFNSTGRDIEISRPVEPQKPSAPDSVSLPNDGISISRHTDSQKPLTTKTSISAIPDIEISRLADIENSSFSGISASKHLDMQKPVNPDTTTSLLPDTIISSHRGAEPVLQTKQSTLRLEQGMGDRLQDLCRAQGICREVLIEALFEYSEVHPEMQQIVLTQARAKNSQRQQIANQRRAQSMMQRFGQT